MKLALLAVGLLVCSLPAHAAKQYLDIQTGDGQRSRMEQGIEVVASDLEQSSVRVFEPEERMEDKRFNLVVSVFNAGDRPFNFGPENVSIETSTGIAVAVVPYEKLLKEEEKRQTWAKVGAALGAFGNSLQASNAGTSYGTVNAYGSGGWAHGSYSSYNAGEAYAAQSIANAQNQAMFDRMGEENRQRLEALRTNLRTTTVDPGRGAGGQIVIEMPKEARKSKLPVELFIRVQLGEEHHIFPAQFVRR